MKRILSLIMAASILLQMIIPVGSKVTYAQTTEGYGFKWERGSVLTPALIVDGAAEGSSESLVSWELGTGTERYELEYFVENNGVPEKVKFTFSKDSNTWADVTFQVLGAADGTTVIQKPYEEFNFSGIGSEGAWIKHGESEKLELKIDQKSNFPGGVVRIEGMEIRFKWQGNKVYFQTANIKVGNITQYSLKKDGDTVPVTIDILAGLAGYKVSPIHVELDGDKIKNKGTIRVPNDPNDPDNVERPGSKPGIKVEFKGPKEFKDGEFKPAKREEFHAVLDLKDLMDTTTTQLKFNLETLAIEDLENKLFDYDEDENTYSLYLTKDGPEHENIVLWNGLEESMTLKTARLSLERGLGDDKKGLGIFAPQGTSGHTYLGYTIKRSSIAEASMEIQPYSGTQNTVFTYIIRAGSTTGNMPILVQHTHRTTGDKKEKPITVSVPFSPDFTDQYYQIEVRQGDVTVSSQILHYRPKEDSTVHPPAPIIQSVDNIYVVPPKELGNEPETIGFDLTWSAPKNSSQNPTLKTMLENGGKIYYELFFHEDLEAADDKGTMIKVFEVSQDSEGNVVVTDKAGTAGNPTTSPGERYTQSKDSFTMENIVLKNPGIDKWEQIKVDSTHEGYEEGREYPEFNSEDTMDPKDVPGIYYITMRALYEDETGANEMGISGTSNPKSITISPLEEIIPVPTKLESKSILDETGKGIISQSFSWGNINIDRYVKQMLDPLNLKVGGDEKGVYEIYLYQEKNLEESKVLDAGLKDELDPNNSSYDLKDEDINTLRAGNAIRLDYKNPGNTGMSTINLKGLDKNQVYYMSVRVRLDIVDPDDSSFEEKRYSVLSKEHSFTSAVEPNEPGPGERVPPVPEKLQLIDQPNNTTAKIGWEAPDYTKQEGEELYYEMLRLDSRILAKEEDSRLLTITKLLEDDEEEEMAAWRTKGLLVEKYTKPDLWTPAIPEQESAKLQLEDPGLSPNKIYYYYVRTVLELEGEEIYSSWIGIPVTTDPIQKPIQLKVEDKEDYPHDPKKEIVVSFLAPIPQGADIPSDYDFDIAVQGELDDDYRLDYSTTRVTSTMDEKDIPTGYSHYVYKIRNLKPGKRYDIKVRVIDKVVDMVNGEYPKSLYSDRVTTRTHFDQDEQDKDDKFDEYLKYFEDKVEALRRKPYWTLEDRESLLSIKYRSNYITPEINSSNAYQLEVREGVSEFNYYMPASVIASANLGQTSFEIKQGNVTYSVRPSTITTELEELKVALQDISEKYIRDYYVVFNFSQRPNRAGTDFLTPEISVDTELARLREEDLFIEDDIMVDLNERINSEKVRFIDDLERALDRGRILDEDLEILMNKSLESIQRNHQRDVRNIISRNTHRTVSIDKWSKNMLIMAIIDGNAVAEGYLLGNPDTALTTFNVGGGYGIEISRPGTYAFKGQKINMPVVPGAPGAGDLVAKYQLTDFFGINGNIDPSRPVSKRNVLGAMARVLGAPRGADYIQYLKQMNIKGINNIGMDSPIKKSEGIYLLMQVYEKTHKKPISTVYIKNRNAVSNIRQFNQLHQPYVLVAVDSKIISQGGGIRPNDAMPTKDVLQILTNIMATVR